MKTIFSALMLFIAATCAQVQTHVFKQEYIKSSDKSCTKQATQGAATYALPNDPGNNNTPEGGRNG